MNRKVTTAGKEIYERQITTFHFLLTPPPPPLSHQARGSRHDRIHVFDSFLHPLAQAPAT